MRKGKSGWNGGVAWRPNQEGGHLVLLSLSPSLLPLPRLICCVLVVVLALLVCFDENRNVDRGRAPLADPGPAISASSLGRGPGRAGSSRGKPEKVMFISRGERCL